MTKNTQDIKKSVQEFNIDTIYYFSIPLTIAFIGIYSALLRKGLHNFSNASIVSSFIYHEVMGPDAMILVY